MSVTLSTDGTSRVPKLPATAPKEPVLSPPLRDAVARAMQPHPDLGLRGMSLPPQARKEAETAIARYDQLLQPADKRRIMAWLIGVNAGMAQPIPAKEFAARAVELLGALGDLPAGVFTSGTRHEAQIAFKWFPGVSEAHTLLRTHAMPIAAKRIALARLLEIGEAPPAEALTQEQRDEVVGNFRQKFDAAIAEMRARVMDNEGAAPRARYLSRDELRATYEQIRQDDPNPFSASMARARLRSLGVDAPEPVKETADQGQFPARDDPDEPPWE